MLGVLLDWSDDDPLELGGCEELGVCDDDPLELCGCSDEDPLVLPDDWSDEDPLVLPDDLSDEEPLVLPDDWSDEEPPDAEPDWSDGLELELPVDELSSLRPRAASVWSSSCPLGLMFLACCSFFTAAWVFGPMTPSAGPGL